MRVAYTVEQCWHRVPGGTAISALEIARALQDHDDIELVGVAARHRGPPPDPWVPPLEVRHIGFPRPLLYEWWHRLRRAPVDPATGPIDVIHATSLAVPPRTEPLLVTIHDLLFLKQPAHFTKRGVAFFTRGLQAALADADLVMCPSSATIEDCVEAGFARDRLRLVPMGVGTRAATEKEVAAAKARYGLAKPYVLWVGTVEPRKNLGTLLLAFDSIRADVDLVLVGPQGWNEDLESLLERRQHRVKVLGFVPLDDLAAVYAGAVAFCFPSLYEGFGLPVLEAMVQGTPVITSRGTSTEEVAGNAGYLVDPRDATSIAEGIERILEDGSFARKLGKAGRERAALYPWTRTAGLVRDLYRELTA